MITIFVLIWDKEFENHCSKVVMQANKLEVLAVDGWMNSLFSLIVLIKTTISSVKITYLT